MFRESLLLSELCVQAILLFGLTFIRNVFFVKTLWHADITGV